MKKLSLLLIAIFAVVLVLPVSVLAHEGSEHEDPALTEQKKKEYEEYKSKKKTESKKDKSTAKQKTEEKKQAVVEAKKTRFNKNVCEERKDALNNLSSKYRNGGKKVQTRLDNTYERVKKFYESKGLQVSNYAELTAAVDTNKAAAVSAMETVNGYKIAIDCDSEDVAAQADAYRQAAQAAREKLKAYRTSLIEFIKAVKTAAQAQESEG